MNRGKIAKILVGLYFGITDEASISEAWSDAIQSERDSYLGVADEILALFPPEEMVREIAEKYLGKNYTVKTITLRQ